MAPVSATYLLFPPVHPTPVPPPAVILWLIWPGNQTSSGHLARAFLLGIRWIQPMGGSGWRALSVWEPPSTPLAFLAMVVLSPLCLFSPMSGNSTLQLLPPCSLHPLLVLRTLPTFRWEYCH